MKQASLRMISMLFHGDSQIPCWRKNHTFWSPATNNLPCLAHSLIFHACDSRFLVLTRFAECGEVTYISRPFTRQKVYASSKSSELTDASSSASCKIKICRTGNNVRLKYDRYSRPGLMN